MYYTVGKQECVSLAVYTRNFKKFSANAGWLFYVVDLLTMKYKMI
jgi:hypothetical protein